jgi:predicted CxxxxCH...CXXCH cytochrome family protein
VTKRRTKIGIAVGIGIVVILAVVAIGAAAGIGAGIGLGAPGIPHGLQGRDDCVSCHSSGAHQYPDWHAERSYDSDRCADCHHPNGNE